METSTMETSTMKYFTSDSAGENHIGTRITDVRAWFNTHPEAEKVYRFWWDRDDLIDVETVTRDRAFTTTARNAEAGATAQWAQSHRRLTPAQRRAQGNADRAANLAELHPTDPALRMIQP